VRILGAGSLLVAIAMVAACGSPSTAAREGGSSTADGGMDAAQPADAASSVTKPATAAKPNLRMRTLPLFAAALPPRHLVMIISSVPKRIIEAVVRKRFA